MCFVVFFFFLSCQKRQMFFFSIPFSINVFFFFFYNFTTYSRYFFRFAFVCLSKHKTQSFFSSPRSCLEYQMSAKLCINDYLFKLKQYNGIFDCNIFFSSFIIALLDEYIVHLREYSERRGKKKNKKWRTAVCCFHLKREAKLMKISISFLIEN